MVEHTPLEQWRIYACACTRVRLRDAPVSSASERALLKDWLDYVEQGRDPLTYAPLSHVATIDWINEIELAIRENEIHDAALRHFAEQRRDQARRAALAKAERQRAKPPDTELEALFQRAYDAMEAEGDNCIGHPSLVHKTRQMVGRAHPRHADITRTRAETFLKRRRSGTT